MNGVPVDNTHKTLDETNQLDSVKDNCINSKQTIGQESLGWIDLLILKLVQDTSPEDGQEIGTDYHLIEKGRVETNL